MSGIKGLWALAVMLWVGFFVMNACVKTDLTRPNDAWKKLNLSCKEIVENVRADAPNPEVKAIRDACNKVWVADYLKAM